MKTPTSRLLRHGGYAIFDATYTLHTGRTGPDIWGHVRRAGFLHHEWELTAGRDGEPYAFGSTLTDGGAWVEATAAAHRPGPWSAR